MYVTRRPIVRLVTHCWQGVLPHYIRRWNVDSTALALVLISCDHCHWCNLDLLSTSLLFASMHIQTVEIKHNAADQAVRLHALTIQFGLTDDRISVMCQYTMLLQLRYSMQYNCAHVNSMTLTHVVLPVTHSFLSCINHGGRRMSPSMPAYMAYMGCYADENCIILLSV